GCPVTAIQAAGSRRPGPSARPAGEPLALADWLGCWGVTKAGMEATGDYWKPVYFLLESQGLGCGLYNAAQVEALPGRPKTDRADSIWLARITGLPSVISGIHGVCGRDM